MFRERIAVLKPLNADTTVEPIIHGPSVDSSTDMTRTRSSILDEWPCTGRFKTMNESNSIFSQSRGSHILVCVSLRI